MSAPQQRPGASAASVPADLRAKQAAAPESIDRQRIRWFVAGHVGAVALLYLIAAWVGDGWAPPPFPPDLTEAQRQQLLAPASAAPMSADPADRQPAPTRGQSVAPDLAAPWHQAAPEVVR